MEKVPSSYKFCQNSFDGTYYYLFNLIYYSCATNQFHGDILALATLKPLVDVALLLVCK